MTSTLIQLVSSASRASSAVRIASLAVWQPAVLGRKCARPAEQVDQALVLAGEADAADRGGHHLGPAGRDRIQHHLAVGIAGGAEEQPRAELAARDGQRYRAMAGFIDSTSLPRAHDLDARRPAESRVSRQAGRGTTAPLSATAIPRPPASISFASSSAATVAALERLALAVHPDGRRLVRPSSRDPSLLGRQRGARTARCRTAGSPHRARHPEPDARSRRPSPA